jgi:hypothetical protein
MSPEEKSRNTNIVSKTNPKEMRIKVDQDRMTGQTMAFSEMVATQLTPKTNQRNKGKGMLLTNMSMVSGISRKIEVPIKPVISSL